MRRAPPCPPANVAVAAPKNPRNWPGLQPWAGAAQYLHLRTYGVGPSAVHSPIPLRPSRVAAPRPWVTAIHGWVTATGDLRFYQPRLSDASPNIEAKPLSLPLPLLVAAPLSAFYFPLPSHPSHLTTAIRQRPAYTRQNSAVWQMSVCAGLQLPAGFPWSFSFCCALVKNRQTDTYYIRSKYIKVKTDLR